MIKIFLPLVVVGVLFEGAGLCAAEPYTLVENGISKCAIVLPHDATASMEYGANDLSKHLKLMSGAEVAVYKQKGDSDLPGNYEGLIVLSNTPAEGETRVGNEEFQITSKPGTPWTLRIYGDNKRGAMYGCYALLQDVLGCRWFTSTISRIPKNKTLVVGALTIHQKPSFELRDPYYYEALVNTEWIVRNRVNGSQCKVDDSVGGKVRYGTMIAHTMLGLVPPDTYFDTHPEYFALVNGRRVRDRQLCLTHPDTLKIGIARIKQLIKENPGADIFSVSQMDNEGGACQCANCLKVTTGEGAESGPILKFVNAVAKEIGKEHPNVLIETLAYNYSQTPPKHVTPLPNVRVRLCIPWSCKAHSLDSACSKDAYQDLLAWSKITNQIYVWDYNAEFNDYMLLHPSLNYTKTVFAVFKKTGVAGVFMQGSYQSPGGSLAEIKSYLCARLMWDHTQNPDTILNEYIDGVYGKSAPIIKEWIALIHSPFDNNDGVRIMGIYDSPNSAYLTKEILDKSDELMKKAIAVSADDPVTLDEIGKIRMWIDYTRLAQLKLRGEVKGGTYTYGVGDPDLDRIDRWMASVKHYKVTHVAEAFPYDGLDILTRKNAELACLSLDNDKLRLDVVPALGGKIVRLLDKKNGVDLMLPPESVFHKAEGGYEEYLAELQGGTEFWGIHYDGRIIGNTITLQGRSPAGREVTRRFTLEGNTLVLKTMVRNTAAQSLPVTIWTRPQFPLRDFKDVHISFDQVGGGAVALEAKDFSINWSELSKKYEGNDVPAGKVVCKLKDTTLTTHFNPRTVGLFQVFNNGGVTQMISLELHGKPVILQPNETASFEQRWVIE